MAEKIQIESIRTDAGTQAREGIHGETVQDYATRMEEGDEFPPVIVFHDGADYFLSDGFHRVMAAKRIGYLEIMAEVRKGTREDALWFALAANKRNGQRMRRVDVRHAVEVALQTWPERTCKTVGEQVGCSETYVQKLQGQLTTSGELTLPTPRMGKDGRERPTSYQKRDPAPAAEQGPDPEPVDDGDWPGDEPTEREEDGGREETEGGPRPGLTRQERRELAALPSVMGMYMANLAVSDLEQIPGDDPELEEGLNHVKTWIESEQRRANVSLWQSCRRKDEEPTGKSA